MWLQKSFIPPNTTLAPPVGADHGPEAAMKYNKSDWLIDWFSHLFIYRE